MGLLIFYLCIALFTSFLCSILEAILLSTPIHYLKIQKEKGEKSASSILHYKENIDEPLSAILSLNTVAHTIGAAGVGAQATIVFGEAYFGIVSAILTILILVLTEIIPKTIGARYWKQLILTSAPVLKILIFITYPLVKLSAIITKLISGDTSDKTTSREEISALAHIGKEEGIFEEKENKIIQNLIKLKNVKVKDIMTPRVVVSVSDQNMSLKKFMKSKASLRFSRIPIYSENEENITGYIFRYEVFEKLAENQNELQLKDIKREIIVMPNSVPIYDAWELMLSKKEHIALIIDEYGGMDGIVTLEDIIETLLGFEIIDEKDTVTDMQEYARSRWKAKQKEYKWIKEFGESED
ncbi:hemolysin family protein [Aureibacter tunicatorum]|uniref:CBS domain containing-hemolysin-like protein n=1 Tax=Aureibacter tunicatorum TaxID=866807 RepID=A0AAE3XKL2_9BACT|nr:hemolysin family protein [Aureibacter tunicatorum]MDR6238607.1 CBS domain containing-hemolysin-like protein [Aureibacter tunicatorum]BDD05462.1 hypothetical protein AUTU_29450 [Aureibacter tunicatorum]